MDSNNQIIKNIDKSMDLAEKLGNLDDLSVEENKFLNHLFQSLFDLRFEITYYLRSYKRKFELIEEDLKEFTSQINKFNADIKNTILTSNSTRYTELNKLLAELSSQFSVIVSNFNKEYDDFDKNFIRLFVNFTHKNNNDDETEDDKTEDDEKRVNDDVTCIFELIENSKEAREMLKTFIRDRPRFRPVLDEMSKRLKSLKLSDDIEMSIMNVIVQAKVNNDFDPDSLLSSLECLHYKIVSDASVIEFINIACLELKMFKLNRESYFVDFKIELAKRFVNSNTQKSKPEKLAELKSQIVKHRINNKELINDHVDMLTSKRDSLPTFESRLMDTLSSTIDRMYLRFDSLYISDDLTDLYLQIHERFHYEKEIYDRSGSRY
jgi:hypothetical protein